MGKVIKDIVQDIRLREEFFRSVLYFEKIKFVIILGIYEMVQR